MAFVLMSMNDGATLATLWSLFLFHFWDVASLNFEPHESDLGEVGLFVFVETTPWRGPSGQLLGGGADGGSKIWGVVVIAGYCTITLSILSKEKYLQYLHNAGRIRTSGYLAIGDDQTGWSCRRRLCG